MEDKKFMIVSNNKIYVCNGIDELKPKINALNTFNFTYCVYYLCQGEWTELLISADELIQTFDRGLADGLKGVSNGGCSKK